MRDCFEGPSGIITAYDVLLRQGPQRNEFTPMKPERFDKPKKPTVSKNRDPLFVIGQEPRVKGHVQVYTASLGPFRAKGTTRDKAKRNVLTLVSQEPDDIRPFVALDPTGGLWLVWREYGSWVYETPSRSLTYYEGTKEETIELLKKHMRQLCGPIKATSSNPRYVQYALL